MGVKVISGCVDCPAEMGCVSYCPHKEIKVYTCDKCKEEIDGDVFEVDDEYLCEACLCDRFRLEG